MKRSASAGSGHSMTHVIRKKMKMDNNIDDAHKNMINNKPSSSNRQINSPENSAGEIKHKAMTLYTEKKFDLAIIQCTILIELYPNDAINYGNRSACYMMVKNYIEALKDARKSVELNPEFITGHCRVIKCALKLHELEDMDRSVAKLKLIDPTNQVLQYQAQAMQELASYIQHLKIACAAKDHVKALEYIEKCLMISPESLLYKVKKAECLAHLRRFTEAEPLANEILAVDSYNSRSHYVLGMCLNETDIGKSVYHFEEAFRLNPNLKKDQQLYQKAKKFLELEIEANNAYNNKNFSQAYHLYRQLFMKSLPNKLMMMNVLFNMAEASYKLGNLDRCLLQCARVLSLKPDHQEALVRRAQCYMDRKHYQNAFKELEEASSIKPSAEIVRMMREAQGFSRAPEIYSCCILGISRGASAQMITKAYENLMKSHREQEEFHKIQCEEITKAYTYLTEQRLMTESLMKKSSEGQENNEASKKLSASDHDNSSVPKASSRSSTNGTEKSSPSTSATLKPIGPKWSSGCFQCTELCSCRPSERTSNGQQPPSGTGDKKTSKEFNYESDEDDDSDYVASDDDTPYHPFICPYCELEVGHGLNECPTCGGEFGVDRDDW